VAILAQGANWADAETQASHMPVGLTHWPHIGCPNVFHTFGPHILGRAAIMYGIWENITALF
jgi:hypothetical protein